MHVCINYNLPYTGVQWLQRYCWQFMCTILVHERLHRILQELQNMLKSSDSNSLRLIKSVYLSLVYAFNKILFRIKINVIKIDLKLN